ncbi:hypothetical protein [Burkholderia anthina]|uniref:gp53-like domain-containing protein n=1 Tax=Burkholderia anthina TaxID=179879 RepID=UPI002931E713|nr:hypothetical protein [Burkholderia anthina]WJN74356.1 hypothetical protein OH687_29020 [Burkholderia anthina]
MYQIDSSGAAVSQPTPAPAGSPGWWTNGNPATATPATVLDADWFNAIQAELLAFLTAANISPVKGTNNQVLAAAQLLFATVSGNSSQTFNVAQATSNTQALRLDQFTGSISNPGFLAIPFTAGILRKMYIQFGIASVGANSTLNVNYATAFPNGVLAVFATRASGGSDHAVNASSASLSQIALQNYGTSTESINWLAIGW